MSFLDALLFGVRKVFRDAVEQPVTTGLDFAGAGWTLTQGTDAENKRKTAVAFVPTGDMVAAGSLVASRLNEAVAAGVTSIANDVAIPLATTVVFLVDIQQENSASARTGSRNVITITRSGGASPVIQSNTAEAVASGYTFNVSIFTNAMRVTVTRAAGSTARLDTRIYQLRSYPTVEFS